MNNIYNFSFYYENFNDYYLSYTNDGISKIFFDIFSYLGVKFVSSLFYEITHIFVYSMTSLNRLIENGKTVYHDTLYLINDKYIVDIEPQGQLDVEILTDKILQYQGYMKISGGKQRKKIW
jgi:hypothetical protein